MIHQKRVLYVPTCNPFISGGGSQATRAYLDATIDIFGAKNVDVFINQGTQIPESYRNVNFIEIAKRPGWESKLFFFIGVLGRLAMPTLRYLKEHSDEYGWCIFNGGREAGWCFKRIRYLKIKKVTIHHNYEVKYCMDTKSIYTLGNLWPYTVRHEERNAYLFSDINLFLTKQDMCFFDRIYGKTKAYNCLIGTFDYKDAEIITPKTISKEFDFVASGSLVNYQSIHGVLDFYNRYFCIAKKQIENMKLLLTGKDPSHEILKLQNNEPDTITIVPSPNDIMREVQRGKIYLCPTDIGGGLKLRAMDGLKCGLPVIAHKISARGYDYFFDKPYYHSYCDEKSFEEALNAILVYQETNSNCAEQINRDYYAYFGYQKGVERMRESLQINSKL